MAKETAEVASLAAAREWLDRAFAAARTKTEAGSQEDWNAPLAPNPFFGEIPRFVIIGAITGHTAHHRGALTVYARLNNTTPPIIYMEMLSPSPFVVGGAPLPGASRFAFRLATRSRQTAYTVPRCSYASLGHGSRHGSSGSGRSGRSGPGT